MAETSNVARSEIAYTPAEVARYTLEELQRRKDHKSIGVPMGLGPVDAKMNPLRPGELVTLLGRPGHYKSGLAQWWARWLALDILNQQQSDMVVYGTCEMAIEELGLYDLAVQASLDASAVARGDINNAEWDALEAASMKRAALPLWLLGHSLARRKKRAHMSIYTIEQALYWIEDHMEFKARVVFLDYLNLLESDRKAGYAPERRIDIADIVKAAKDMALFLGCPVVLLAQAHRRADERAWKLPQMADAMESAAIEQYSDKIFSVWMPRITDHGVNITSPAGEVLNAEDTEHMLILGMLKQKNGPAGGYFKLYVDPARNYIAPLETWQDAADVPPSLGDNEEIPF